jgi:hypothetical protein
MPAAADEPVVSAGFTASVYAVDADGDHVLFASGSRNLDPLVDARDPEGTYLGTPSSLGRLVPEGSTGVDITPDGRTAAVLSHGRIAWLSVDEYDGLHVIAEGVCCTAPSISADGRFVAWADPRTGVFVHDRADGETTHVDASKEAGAAQLSDDGATLAYPVFGEGVFVRELPDGGRERITDEDGPAALSGDGRVVAWTQDDVVVVHDRDTGTERRLGDGHTSSSSPSLDADGSHVAYGASRDDGFVQVHVRDLVTDQVTVIGDGVAPALSRDGRAVVFQSGAAGLVPGVVLAPGSDLFMADVATGAIRLLTVGRDAGLQQLRTDGFVNAYGAAQPRTPQPRLDGAAAIAAPPYGNGFWVANAAGRVAHAGHARDHGQLTTPLARPIVDMASSPTGAGYWLVASDGGVFTFGDAEFHGSTGAMRLNQPIVGMAPTPSGRGYWLVAADGGIFSFGDARFHGSTGAIRLNQPIVGMARTRSGNGYWLVARDGGIFAFGDAPYLGSTGAIPLNQPIVAMVRTSAGHGYRLVARDGGVSRSAMPATSGDRAIPAARRSASSTPRASSARRRAAAAGASAPGSTATATPRLAPRPSPRRTARRWDRRRSIASSSPPTPPAGTRARSALGRRRCRWRRGRRTGPPARRARVGPCRRRDRRRPRLRRCAGRTTAAS